MIISKPWCALSPFGSRTTRDCVLIDLLSRSVHPLRAPACKSSQLAATHNVTPKGTARRSVCSAAAEETNKLLMSKFSPAMSLPAQIVPAARPISLTPCIQGFQYSITSLLSSLIKQQDGCMQLVAQHYMVNKKRQTQLEQQLALLSSHVRSPEKGPQKAPSTSDNPQGNPIGNSSSLERDNCLRQKDKLFEAHM